MTMATASVATDRGSWLRSQFPADNSIAAEDAFALGGSSSPKGRRSKDAG